MRIFPRHIIRLALLPVLLAVALAMQSCADDDYLNAIPRESVMLVSMDTPKLSGVGSQSLLKALLRTTDLDKSGLDLSSNVYLFEDAQGNFGVCARVSSAGDLADFLSSHGVKSKESGKNSVAALPSNWLIGYDSRAALLMGPVLPAAQADMGRLMARYLKQGEEEGIKASPLYAKLDSIGTPMALVAQVKALPSQLAAPLTIGAPRDADPADIYLAAAMDRKGDVMQLTGETFSLKKQIDQALKKAEMAFRPISGRYANSMSIHDAIGLFVNVDGRRFHDLITQNRSISSMLAGINAAIDMDNILKSVNGDLALVTASAAKDNFQLTMAAKLGDAKWLADVDYWKQSVPQGGVIGDWGRDCYYYRGGGTNYYFGVTPDWQYMSGGSPEAARASIRPASEPLSLQVRNLIKGERMAMVINLRALKASKAGAFAGILTPLFGDADYILFVKR